MLCDACKKNNATVHTMTIINGVKQERYLCAQCANAAQYTLPSLMDILGFYPQAQRTAPATCSCGIGADTFRQTGLLGCPDCYATFRNQLEPIIKQVQGGRIRHVGRTPVQQTDAVNQTQASSQNELTKLKEDLHNAVLAEQYERAAELRDRIKALEAKE